MTVAKLSESRQMFWNANVVLRHSRLSLQHTLSLSIGILRQYPQTQNGTLDACDVTLSVYLHRASLKNMPDHGGNRTYDLWNTSPMLCQQKKSHNTEKIMITRLH
jgi:hypothetical protein